MSKFNIFNTLGFCMIWKLYYNEVLDIIYVYKCDDYRLYFSELGIAVIVDNWVVYVWLDNDQIFLQSIKPQSTKFSSDQNSDFYIMASSLHFLFLYFFSNII